MKFKVAIFSFVLSAVLIPAQSYASAANAAAPTAGKPQIRIQIGKRHDHGLHRGWYKGKRISYYNYDRRSPQYVRQVYRVNGRQYVRWIRYN